MTKRRIPIFCFLLFAFFCNTNLYAQKTITTTKEMPLEISLIINSLQKNAPSNFDHILPLVKVIDRYARSMSKEDIFLIGKIEVYKTFLKNQEAPIKQPIDGNTITTLRAAITKSNDRFVTWFLEALLKDSQDLINNPLYKEFLLQKNNNIKLEKIEYRKLEKKGELLQYWISKIALDSTDFPASLQTFLTPKMFDALKNIQNSFTLMATSTSMSPLAEEVKSDNDLKFFVVEEMVPNNQKTPPNPSEQKSVEEILAPITDTSPKDLPSPTQENWLEDKNAPKEMQNLPKPSNDAEWLQDF